MKDIMSVGLGRGYAGKVYVDTWDRLNLGWYNWRVQVTPRGTYAVTHSGGQPLYMHRLIAGAVKGQMVDHIDCDGLNNLDDNLRLCTAGQNRANSRKDRDNKSGFKGVTWSPTSRKWMAQLCHQGKRYYLGVYAHKERAARAHDRKAIEIHGEFAGLNFPRLNK